MADAAVAVRSVPHERKPLAKKISHNQRLTYCPAHDDSWDSKCILCIVASSST